MSWCDRSEVQVLLDQIKSVREEYVHVYGGDSWRLIYLSEDLKELLDKFESMLRVLSSADEDA